MGGLITSCRPQIGNFRGGFLTGNRTLSRIDRKSTRLNSSHRTISYAVFCLKKKIVRRQRLPDDCRDHARRPLASAAARRRLRPLWLRYARRRAGIALLVLLSRPFVAQPGRA